MAPELLRGMEDRCPERCAYSLGALLYRCLAGVRCSRRRRPEVISQQIIQGAIPQLRRVPCGPAPDQPPGPKCLALDPAKRFNSAGELHDGSKPSGSGSAWTRARCGAPVAFMYRDGPVAEEALTVVDPGLLEQTRTGTLLRR